MTVDEHVSFFAEANYHRDSPFNNNNEGEEEEVSWQYGSADDVAHFKDTGLLYALGREEDEEGREYLALTIDEEVEERMEERSRKRKADEVEAEERRVKGEKIRKGLEAVRDEVEGPRRKRVRRVDEDEEPPRQAQVGWEAEWCFPDSDEEEDEDE